MIFMIRYSPENYHKQTMTQDMAFAKNFGIFILILI